MNIIFRADSSSKIGTGHIMRCLVLAEKLKEKNCNVIFICKNEKGNINNIIINKGYKLYILEEDNWQHEEIKNIIFKEDMQVDWLIVDHYGLDFEFEYQMYNYVNNIMVIDDLANRRHFCNVLLDQNLSDNTDKYNSLVPQGCKKFLGLEYLLLRDEFKSIPRRIRNKIENILISFGGSDSTNETLKVLEGLKSLQNINVDVVIGSSNTNKYIIKYFCYKQNYNYYEQINNIAELIDKADIAIGAGGVSLWERCFLGLPSLVTITADNQIEGVNNVNKLQCIKNIGWFENIKSEDYYNAILNLNSNKLSFMSNNCLNLFKENKVGEIIDYLCTNR
jgi:UDP-2,4-diacetamido-2,4,6-trideoxy-beta-L-altropyranose hydrolase